MCLGLLRGRAPETSVRPLVSLSLTTSWFQLFCPHLFSPHALCPHALCSHFFCLHALSPRAPAAEPARRGRGSQVSRRPFIRAITAAPNTGVRVPRPLAAAWGSRGRPLPSPINLLPDSRVSPPPSPAPSSSASTCPRERARTASRAPVARPPATTTAGSVRPGLGEGGGEGAGGRRRRGGADW